jgi:AAA domain-containing protein
MIPCVDEFKREAENTRVPRDDFKLVMAGDMVANAKPTEWLVNKIIPANAFSSLIGPSGSYKTFVQLSWCASIASSTSWFGYRVQQAPVIVIIGEGHNGYAKRIYAWCKANNVDVNGIPLAVSKVPMQMLNDDSAIQVAEAVNTFSKQYGECGMVCIDTLARNFGPGDENSTQDMTKFIANCDKYIGHNVHRQLVHHTGHGNQERGRGSSALYAALDVEYRVQKNGDTIVLDNTKMKDDPEFQKMAFIPQPVTLGAQFGDSDSSVVLAHTENHINTHSKVSIQMRRALELLELLCKESSRNETATWMQLCTQEDVYTKGSFYNAVTSMEEKGLVKITNGCVEKS